MSSERLLQHPKALCNQVKRIAEKAGEMIIDYFEAMDSSDITDKSDGSPVTQADRSAEALIEKHLFEITPEIPIVGEEAAETGRLPDVAGAEYFWCVDPLDGTKEFISGSGDFTVNIALIHRHKAIMGVVYAPYTGEMYSGVVNEGAHLLREDLVSGKVTSDREINVRQAPEEGLVVVASRSHSNSEKLDRFLENYKVSKLTKRGSSLKICTIAAGKADLYPRLGPTCEWDTAAAHAVLKAAGGEILDFHGEPLTYGHQNRKFLNPEFIALSDTALYQP